jgi:hypothetical protein
MKHVLIIRWSHVLWHCVELDETVSVDHYKDASASRALPQGHPPTTPTTSAHEPDRGVVQVGQPGRTEVGQ